MKTLLKQYVLPQIFRTGQRLGFDVLPRHFYSEIPDMRKLDASRSWRSPYQPPVRGWSDLESQIDFAKNVLSHCTETVDDLRNRLCEQAGEFGFGPLETAALVSFVRTVKPPRIVQVGCGASTAMMLEAADYSPELICIEPYPSDYLRSLTGRITLWAEPAQDILPMINEAVAEMPSGSLLFIDSSHTLGPAGECTRLICETLPNLPPACYAHFHDIFFPYDYAPTILRRPMFFWHETALLMAFLCCNERLEIACSMSMLHHAMPERLQPLFLGYRPQRTVNGIMETDGHFPSSCYLQTMK